MIFIMKKHTAYLKIYFDLCLYQSILFYDKTATKIISYNQSAIIIVGN